MKAIVTGGMGFIGHNLVRALLDNTWGKWNVMVIDDLSSGKSWNKWPEVEYVTTALEARLHSTKAHKEETAIDIFVKEFNPDVIFHLAAVPRVSYSVEYPYETTQSNVLSTMAVLDAARKYGKRDIRIVYSSSSSIYGGSEILPTPVDCSASPQSPYAMQKWQGEEWCRMYSKLYQVDTVILRYFNVFGKHSYYGGAYSTVLSAWLYSLYVDPHICPFLEGDGLQSRDFCEVENVCQANVLAALHSSKFNGQAFNIAQGEAHTLLDCKNLIEQFSGKVLDLEMRPNRTGDVRHTLADISSSCSVLGYTPNTDFENQVKKMADWFQLPLPQGERM